MPIVTTETEEKNKKKMRDFYYNFMAKEKSKAESFNSLNEFKESDTYKNLPEEEKERLEQYEGKNVIIMVFDNLDQAIEYFEKAQLEGIISKEQADETISDLNARYKPTYDMGM
jgi:hypothetical protein